MIDFDITILYVPFSVFGREKDRSSFILSKVNAQDLSFAPDLYVEIKMCYLRREIGPNPQLVAYRLCTAEITTVQEWILVELRIVDRQR